MRMSRHRTLGILTALLCLGFASGCLIVPRRHPAVHVHGPRCGHVFRNGRWIIVRPRPKTVRHVHRSGCGHVYRDGRWIAVTSIPKPEVRVERPRAVVHVHRSGCGHVFRDGRWVVVDHHRPHKPPKHRGPRWKGRKDPPGHGVPPGHRKGRGKGHGHPHGDDDDHDRDDHDDD